MNSEIDRLNERAVERGGLKLFPAFVAIELVDALERTGTKVLGLDAFRVTKTMTQPLMEKSVDFGPIEESWRLARSHLTQNAEAGLLFEVVF